MVWPAPLFSEIGLAVALLVMLGATVSTTMVRVALAGLALVRIPCWRACFPAANLVV
jgi:hypothetical protein